jgi:hypothetical protein
VVAGPGNSLVVHGKEDERGFADEREVRIVRKENGEEDWTVRYHLTDPVKITMAEKVELVDRLVTFVEEVRDVLSDKVRVVMLTVLPRFVKPCCREHMTEEDVWLPDGLRRDVNREIKEEVTERGLNVEIVEWWTLMGEKEDLTISDVGKRDFLDSDNVHLKKTNEQFGCRSSVYQVSGARRDEQEWSGDNWEEKKSGLKKDPEGAWRKKKTANSSKIQ